MQERSDSRNNVIEKPPVRDDVTVEPAIIPCSRTAKAAVFFVVFANRANGTSRETTIRCHPGKQMGRPGQGRVGGPRGVRPIRLAFIGAILVIAILAFIPSWIQKWLWMRQLGYDGIFWTLFSVRWGLFGAAFVVALLYLWINLRLAVKNGATFRSGSLTGESALATNSASRSLPRF
jgi:hypothetical protein